MEMVRSRKKLQEIIVNLCNAPTSDVNNNVRVCVCACVHVYVCVCVCVCDCDELASCCSLHESIDVFSSQHDAHGYHPVCHPEMFLDATTPRSSVAHTVSSCQAGGVNYPCQIVAYSHTVLGCETSAYINTSYSFCFQCCHVVLRSSANAIS